MKGIIMSGNHPKLILDKLKTMTRRTSGLEEINKNPDEWKVAPTLNHSVWAYFQGTPAKPHDLIRIKCPYGQVGDRLWVRETWADMVCVSSTEKGKGKGESNPHYKASSDSTELKILQGSWKPSIFMHRWASRITLEITDLRAERVQEISPEDCLSEGIPPIMPPQILCSMDNATWYQRRFRDLWDSLNAKRGYGWEVNPWVWVISFKVI